MLVTHYRGEYLRCLLRRIVRAVLATLVIISTDGIGLHYALLCALSAHLTITSCRALSFVKNQAHEGVIVLSKIFQPS